MVVHFAMPVVTMALTLAAGAALACPVCAFNGSTQTGAQWWAVLGVMLVPFAVAAGVAVAIRRLLRREGRAP